MTPGALLVTLIVVGVAVLVFVIWRRSVAAEPPPATPPEEADIWGVGGPAMRQPGSTGIARTLRPPRADQDDD